jgi:hypothetical protein
MMPAVRISLAFGSVRGSREMGLLLFDRACADWGISIIPAAKNGHIGLAVLLVSLEGSGLALPRLEAHRWAWGTSCRGVQAL